MIVFLDGGGAHTREVAAGVRLCHGNGEDALATGAFRQQAPALLLVAEAGQVGTHQPAVQRVVPVPDPGVGSFLYDDLLEAKVGIAHAAVLLSRPDHQEALLTGLAKSLAVDNSGLTPGLHMWHNLLGQELAVGVPEHDLLVGKLSLQHGAYPSVVRSGAQYGPAQEGEQ